MNYSIFVVLKIYLASFIQNEVINTSIISERSIANGFAIFNYLLLTNSLNNNYTRY
jgi:hypothetical protein